MWVAVVKFRKGYYVVQKNWSEIFLFKAFWYTLLYVINFIEML